MMENSKPSVPELRDHEVFRPTLEELDRNLAKSYRGTVIGIVMVLVAIAAALVFENIPNGLLFLMLVLHIYALTTYRAIKGIRNRIAQQMVMAVKHRIRADQLYDLSTLDPLTGLHNRRFGDQRLKREVARTERNSESLAVVLLDLDGFKEINDLYGHAAGDLALREFSRRLRR